MPKKILFVSHDATRTGAPVFFLHLLKWLRSNTDIPFQILLQDGGPLEGEFRALGPAHVLNWNNDSIVRSEKEKFLRNLAKQDFSLIYSNTVANGRILEYLTDADCPILSHVHELEYRIRHQTPPETIAGMIACTDHYITVARAVKNNLVTNHGIPEEKVSVVYGFVPTEEGEVKTGISGDLRKALGIPPDAYIIGACGTSDWRKGPDLFIQLAASVRRNLGKAVHFCWIGAQVEASEFSALAYDVRKANLEDCVHFVEPLQNPRDYFSLFDVFVSTSREDPFPLVNLEAASCGTPVICFDNSGGGKEFVSNDCGFVVRYLDIAGMASGVVELLNNPELREKLGIQAQAKVRQNHDISVGAPKILDAIEAISSKWTPKEREIRMRRISALKNSENKRLRDLFRLISDPATSKDASDAYIGQLNQELQKEGFFQDVYNLASWLDLKQEKSGALVLFQAVSRHASDANPELAGKAFFKIGSSADTDDEALDNLRNCLDLYPAHKAARERLRELTQNG